MVDDSREVDYSIRLQPIDEPAWERRPRRGAAVYLLTGGAILLGLATVLAFVFKMAAIIRANNAPVTVAIPRSAAANRAEAVRVFAAFDAYEERRAQRSTDQQAERDAIEALLTKLKTSAVEKDNDEFRNHFDFDRFVKRMELSGNILGLSNLDKRRLRTQLKSALELEEAWAKLLVTDVVTPTDDPNSRIVYSYGWTAAGGDQSEYRFWLGRANDGWKLYDWERLDIGMAEARRWGLCVRYQSSPLLAGYNRWSNLLDEADSLSNNGNREGAKEKVRLAELQTVPQELADVLWMWTGHRWLSLDEPAEAERCYKNVTRPVDSPGVYLGLMNCKRSTSPAEALYYAQQYEGATGPSPDLLTDKAQLLKRLDRNEEAIETWKKRLRIETDDTQALTQLYLLLPKGNKADFKSQLGRAEKPVAAVESIAPTIGYRDYTGLLQLVDYLQREAPGKPGTIYVAGLTKSLDGRHDEAAKLYLEAYQAETDKEKHEEYGNAYVRELLKGGNVAAAWDALPDPKSAMNLMLDEYDEGDLELTKEEYGQLIEQFRARYPDERDGIVRDARLALQEKRYADAERLSRRALELTPAAVKQEGDSENTAKYYENAIASSLAIALYKQGRVREAYEIVSQRDVGFMRLANEAVDDRRWDDLRTLVELHRAKDPQDWQRYAIEADLAAHEKKWDDAIRLLRDGLKAAKVDERPALQNLLWHIYADSGRWLDLLRDDTDENEGLAFENLADRFVDDENWDALSSLINEHRRRSPNDVRIAPYLARSAAARQDWLRCIEFAERALQDKDVEKLPSYEQSELEEQLVRALLRTKQFTKAQRIVENSKRTRDRTGRLAIVSAASGNWAEAKKLARQSASGTDDASRFYADEDVGHIFLSEQFSDLQREFPVALPTNLAPTLAVFLFDKPWKLEGGDISAALEQAGYNENTPIGTATSSPWTYELHIDNADVWFVVGEGVYDERWSVNDENTLVSGAVKHGVAWLAVGTADWNELDRKQVEAVARRLAGRLAGKQAAVLCVPDFSYLSEFTAYPLGPEILQSWQATGRLSAFSEQGVSLMETHLNDEVAANRQFERSLWAAVRRFESEPGAKLKVTAKLSTKVDIDQLQLDVTKVQRRYGSLAFEGTLANEPDSLPELKKGLAMQFRQSQVQAWKLNDEAIVERP